MKRANFLSHGWLIFLVVPMLTACQAKNPKLQAPPAPPIAKANYVPTETKQDVANVEIDPRVDILLVVDDSDSMRNHIANLSSNLKQFVNGLAKSNGQNSGLDFHIAYTFIHDPIRYGSIVPQVCGADTTTPNRVNWSTPGTLQPIKGLSDRRYVTNTDDFATMLEQTLDPNRPENREIMVKRFTPQKGDASNVCPYGAENEDLFDPLVGIFDANMKDSATNKGFRREGAFFVGILLSDAKDASNMDEQAVYNKLVESVGKRADGKNKFRIFSVVIKPGTQFKYLGVRSTGNGGAVSDVGPCKPDPAWIPDGSLNFTKLNRLVVGSNDNPLANLARLTEDGSLGNDEQILSICSDNYGSQLARYGTQIQQDVLHDQVIHLSSRPQVGTTPDKALGVRIGNVELVQGQQWSFNPSDVTVTVYSRSKDHPQGVDWSKFAGQQIKPHWTPADLTSKNAKAL